jgi:alanyl-tRNA synthetase
MFLLDIVHLKDLNLTDLLILVGIVGYGIDRIADQRGWSRSSRILRQENGDLLRINSELNDTVSRNAEKITQMQTELIELKAEVTTLKARDQAAVLKALEHHEERANERFVTMSGELVKSNVYLADIATALTAPPDNK